MTNKAQRFTVPIGPQHPALKEPGHFEFVVDGEIVQSASMRLGYVHRGIEKAVESRSWVQSLYLLERICGICSHVHASAYCAGVEQLAGVEITPRAAAIRALFAELERIHSHLLWLGVAAHEAGFDTLFMFSWRDRETVMDLLEALSGNRVNYSANVLGGVKYDLTPELIGAIREGLDFLQERTDHYMKVVTQDALLLRRIQGVGVLSKQQALAAGVTGPTARASGVEHDIRLIAPYDLYRDLPVKPVYEQAGDLQARFVVRVRELFTSYDYIRTLLDRLPEGELTTRMPRRIPEGEAIVRVEAPRGELFYFIRSTGGNTPDRVHVRTPTLCNIASLLNLAIGKPLADMPMILIGIDPCFSCNDRVTVCNPEGGRDVWDGERLRQYGIAAYGGDRW